MKNFSKFCLLALIIFLYFIGAGENTAQNISLFKISDNAGIITDRRPISVGFYDSAVNKTFISWMGSRSNAVVKEYNHTTKTWSADKVVGISPFADSHNYPGLIQSKDGRLIVFYGCHNSFLRISKSPLSNSIEGEWTDRNLTEAPGASYPVPIITKDGTIYCFYRITMRTGSSSPYPVDYRPLAYIKSIDNGETWSLPIRFIDNYPRTDNLCEIYNGKISYQPGNDSVSERIHVTWTVAGGGPGHHEHGLNRRHVYYAYMNLSNEHYFSIEGVDLGKEINDAEAENFCKVTDTGTPPGGMQLGYQVSVHFKDNGEPIIIYRHQIDFRCAYWNGNKWNESTIFESQGEPREIEKIGPNSFRAYHTSGKKLYIFKTSNGGVTWTQEEMITAPISLARCYVIENYHNDLKFLLTEAISGDTAKAVANRDIYGGSISVPTNIKENTIEKYTGYELEQNFPNPFNPSTVIRYQLPLQGNVSLKIYDMLGREIAILVNEEKQSGNYEITFNGEGFASGVYYYRLTAGSYAQTKKILLVR